MPVGFFVFCFNLNPSPLIPLSFGKLRTGSFQRKGEGRKEGLTPFRVNLHFVVTSVEPG
jgi:hypothetical protein